MKSPVQSHQSLEQVTLGNGLIAYRCPETSGHWIPLENYWKWQRRTPATESTDRLNLAIPPVSEFDDHVKICPVSGTIMTRYRVGHGLDFRIDRSITGGIWLDGGEWEALQAGNLHHELHLIFTAPWQKAVRNEDHERQYNEMLRKNLGDDFHRQLTVLRDRLKDHPARAEALAYLQGQS